MDNSQSHLQAYINFTRQIFTLDFSVAKHKNSLARMAAF